MFHSTIFKGALYKILLLTMVLLLVLMAVIQKMSDAQASKSSDPPGNISVTAVWDEGPIDVDLWVHGPGEPVPIGYSNKGGKVWNLLRDDLGNYPDFGKQNMENAYSRGVVAGEYTINVHCFTCTKFPVEVEVEVRVTSDINGANGYGEYQRIFSGKVKLTKPGHEKTVVNFRLLDTNGTLDRDSLNNVFRPLRSPEEFKG